MRTKKAKSNRIKIIVTVEDYLEEYLNFFEIERSQLECKWHRGEMVDFKNIYYYFGFKYLSFKKKHLAEAIQREHSMAVHGVKKIQTLVDNNDIRIEVLINQLITHFKVGTTKELYGVLEERYDKLFAAYNKLKIEYKRLKQKT